MKTYLVVGGSKGNGREFIKQLMKSDRNLILLISRENIDLEFKNIIHFPTDLLDEKQLLSTLKSIKEQYKLDSIAFFQKYRSSDGTEDNLRNNFKVTIEATKLIIDATQDCFKKNGLRSIVLIGSIASKFVALEQSADYHIVKSALVGLLNYYAVSLAHFGIRLNMVSPGSIIKDENKIFYKKNKDLTNLYKSVTPLHEITTSSALFNLTYYLLSKKSKFIIGQDVWIESGSSLIWQEALARQVANLDNLKITR